MRRLALGLLGVVALAGCQTTSTAFQVAPNVYEACDVGHSHDPRPSSALEVDCGPNAAWGISKACLPQGKSIIAIRRGPAHGVLVTCGPPLK